MMNEGSEVTQGQSNMVCVVLYGKIDILCVDRHVLYFSPRLSTVVCTTTATIFDDVGIQSTY